MNVLFDAVLFDCDGVLVDSESITNRVLRDMLNEAGWPITTEECLQQFIGKTVRSQAALIESHTRKPFTEDWLQQFYVRRNEALGAELVAIDGALSAVPYLHGKFDGRIACASGADRAKVEMQLEKVGLASFSRAASSAAMKHRAASHFPTCTSPRRRRCRPIRRAAS